MMIGLLNRDGMALGENEGLGGGPLSSPSNLGWGQSLGRPYSTLDTEAVNSCQHGYFPCPAVSIFPLDQPTSMSLSFSAQFLFNFEECLVYP